MTTLTLNQTECILLLVCKNHLKVCLSIISVKRPLGRPKRRWEDNIRMDLTEIGVNTRNLISSVEDRD